MKKGRLLALTLVVAVMLVGAGYAYWSEALSINTTVDTGDLEVIFQEPANVIEEAEYQPNADCTVINDGKGMSLSFVEVYPGLANKFEFDLKNTGTLGAYVRNFRVTDANFDYNLILCKSITVDGHTKQYTGTTLSDALNYLNSLRNNKGIEVDTMLNNPDGEYSYTGEVITVELELEFNKNATEANFPQNDDSLYFNISADVHQFNEANEELPR